MQLLIAVINEPDLLDDVLAGFVEVGITGATILSTEGMGRLLSHDIPIFAGLQTLITRSRPKNRTILTVVEDEKVDVAIAIIEDVCGKLTEPATGIAFTVKLERVVGLAPELGQESSAV